MSRLVIEDRVDITKVKPLGDYVFIEELERVKTVGGIHLPKNKATELCLCRVHAVGPGIRNHYNGKDLPMEISPGDIVITMQYMGERMAVDGKKYRFIHENGCWAKATDVDTETYEIRDIEPRFDNILIRPDSETMTRSGTLFLPNEKNAQAEHRFATVLKVGPGKWRERDCQRQPVEVKEGQHILFRRYAGAEIPVRGEYLRLIQEQDVRGYE